MSALTGRSPSTTYGNLLQLEGGVGVDLRQVLDGLGNATSLSLSSSLTQVAGTLAVAQPGDGTGLKQFEVSHDGTLVSFQNRTAGGFVFRNAAGTLTTFGVTDIGNVGLGVDPYDGYTSFIYCLSTNRLGQAIRGRAGQTANLTEWQNSTGTAVMSVIPDTASTAGAYRFRMGPGDYRDVVLRTQNDKSNFLFIRDASDTTEGHLALGNLDCVIGAFGRGTIAAQNTGINVGNAGQVSFCDGYYSYGTPDIGISRDTAGVLKVTNGSTGIGSLVVHQIRTDNSAAGATLGSVVKKMPVYDAAGTALGYVPIYDTIT